MDEKELKQNLEEHKKWLNNEGDGKRADLRYADLSNADLRYAELGNANLRGADLRNANLDFSVLPLWCGSLKAHFDDKQIIQFIDHAVKAGLHSKNVSTEIKEELKKLTFLANKFRRARECGKLHVEKGNGNEILHN